MALHSPATFADMATLSSFTDPNRYSKGSELDSLGDYLGIDDLLDFSNEEIGGPIGDGSAEINVASSFKSLHTPTVLPAELCVPCDDLAELEWLSNFVEESFSSENAFMINAVSSNLKEANGKESNVQVKKNEFQSASPVSVLQSSAKQACFSPEMAIPGRARSKRSRTGHTMWGTLILAAADTSANMVESSSTSTITVTAPNSPDMDVLKFEQQGATSLLCKKMKSSQNKVKKLFEAVQTRRCLHCGSQKTPQWRTGPMGPKTLCNACGVRYKSGRLLPEYRPAASPTFVESIHSNSHRKVLEMRKHKQESAQGEEPLLWQHQQQQIAGYESETCLVNTRLEEALLQDWQ